MVPPLSGTTQAHTLPAVFTGCHQRKHTYLDIVTQFLFIRPIKSITMCFVSLPPMFVPFKLTCLPDSATLRDSYIPRCVFHRNDSDTTYE